MEGAERTILIDNDVFVALAGANVLERALDVLGSDSINARRLDTLPHVIRRSKTLRRQWSAEALDRASIACGRMPALDEAPARDLLRRLQSVPGIDAGEAILYGLVAERPLILLASGDKRAMTSLCTTPEVAELRDAVAGRVICLESVIRALVVRHGGADIGARFLGITTHQTLRVVFTETNVAHESRCLEAIDQYLADLRQQVGPGFLYEL